MQQSLNLILLKWHYVAWLPSPVVVLICWNLCDTVSVADWINMFLFPHIQAGMIFTCKRHVCAEIVSGTRLPDWFCSSSTGQLLNLIWIKMILAPGDLNEINYGSLLITHQLLSFLVDRLWQIELFQILSSESGMVCLESHHKHKDLKHFWVCLWSWALNSSVF